MNARLLPVPSGPAPTATPTDRSYRRGLLLLGVFGLALLCMLGLWARSSWNDALADAQTDLQQLAAVDALPVALAMRDARRAAEAMDLALTTAPGLDTPALARLLASELALRFHGGETADLFEPGSAAMLATTARDGFSPALLAGQLQRVTKARSGTLGWAYQRDGARWLPLFFVRDAGQVLVINLPVDAMLGHWLAPTLPGENPVGLRSADERVLLRRPFTPAMLGADARGAASTLLIEQQRDQGATAGAVRAVATETDRVERLIGWAQVPGTDLRMLVAAGTDNVFSQWRAAIAPKFLAMAVLIALALGGAALSMRRLQRLAERERRALAEVERANAMARTALWGSRDIAWQMPLAGSDMRFDGDLAQLLGAPAAADGTRQNTLNWLLNHVDAGGPLLVQRAIDDALELGSSVHVRLSARGLDGESRHLVLNGRRVDESVGLAPMLAGTLRDVTAQVVAQNKLNEQTARARLLAEAVATSSQLMLVTDAQQRITWCNNAFTRRTGYSLEEIRGQRPGALLQRGTVPQAINALMARHIASREAFSGVRVQNFSKQGAAYWVDLEVRPIFDDRGDLECFIGLQTDVTHDIEREHAMRESAHRFELATAHAGMGVYELDIERNTRTWSEGMYRLFGFDPARGLPSFDAVDARVIAEDKPLRRPAFLRACQDSSVRDWVGEFRVRRPDGSLAWLQSRCQIERDDAGCAVRAVGTTLDITSTRTVALERQARAEADARSQAKTAFLSQMSHELRTPLHAVIGYAQLINSAPERLPGVAAPFVERIETAGWHLLALIDDILELSLLEREDLALTLQAVSLDDAVREAHAFTAPEADKACLLIELSLEPVVAWANATRVRQVVVNLLSNAIKYNLAAGSVRIAVRREGEQACVEVADTGLGMTEAQLAGLYEPFNRLGRETSGVPGTGIGLAITKRLVERMDGTLEVSSCINAGTTFTLRLPLAASTERAVSTPEPTRAAPVPRALDVLCIEDNEVNALLLREMLHRLRPGWPVRVAATGYDATQMLRDAPADLVFLDLNLPDTQGLEWLDYARGAELLRGAEVALLTADVMPQTRDTARAAGLRHFLSKPFLIADLEGFLNGLAGSGEPAVVDTVR